MKKNVMKQKENAKAQIEVTRGPRHIDGLGQRTMLAEGKAMIFFFCC
jgi:hypothetical protein